MAAIANAEDQSEALLSMLMQWREPLLIVLLVCECIPILGFASPGLIVLVLAGAVASQLEPLLGARMLGAAFIAVAMTDLALFALGRVGTRHNGFVARWIGARSTFGEQLASQPFLILLFYQFPPYSRMFGPLLLGATGISWTGWLRVCLLGTGMFVVCFFAVGLIAGLAGSRLADAVGGAAAASTVLLIPFVIWLVLFVRQLIAARRARAR